MIYEGKGVLSIGWSKNKDINICQDEQLRTIFQSTTLACTENHMIFMLSYVFLSELRKQFKICYNVSI